MRLKPPFVPDDLVACPACDRLHRRIALVPGEIARCERCHAVLQTNKVRSIDRSLAAALSALLLLALALSLPFLELSRAGIVSGISVLDATVALWRSDFRLLGLVSLGFIAILPLARLALLAFVLGAVRFGNATGANARRAFRWAIALEPWAMADIFMVGVVVALVKISTLARLEVGTGFWALLGVIAASIMLNGVLCHDTVWQRLSRRAAPARESRA